MINQSAQKPAFWQSQLEGTPYEARDSAETNAARAMARDYDGFVALGGALTKQLLYREAAEAYTSALAERPDELSALRLRAGRYLSTLQCKKAEADLIRCLELGGEIIDIKYRLGLCAYYQRDYAAAMRLFCECLPLCGDELGIALIYWHTLCAYCCGTGISLLAQYHAGMDVGHHTAYEKAVSVCAGARTVDEALADLECEMEDLEYVTALYGICAYLRHKGKMERSDALMQKLLVRNSFWPCYAWLAAWNDASHTRGALP